MKELVGQVSQEEMEIIKSLFERKNGLLELLLLSILNSSSCRIIKSFRMICLTAR